MRYTEEYWEDAELVCRQIPQIEKLFGHTVLLTGSTGMLCSPVAELLLHLNRRHGADIRILLTGRDQKRLEDRFRPFREGQDYYFCYLDTTGELAIDERADYIIHAGGNAHPLSILEEPVQTIISNVRGTQLLLQYAYERQAKRFLYISSSEVYGKNSFPGPYKETQYGFVDVLNPRACYPLAKRTGENCCIAYMAQYGTDVVIIRPGHIYGPSIKKTDSRASAQFSLRAKEGKDIVLKSAGTQFRSYCYTLDSASAVLTALLNGQKGEAYNISNPASVVTIREMAEALAEAGRVSVVFEMPTETEKKSFNMMDNSALDATKLINLGWKPLFDLESGTRKTLQYMNID